MLQLNLRYLEVTSPNAAAAVRATASAADVIWIRADTGDWSATRGQDGQHSQLCSVRDPLAEGRCFADAIDLHATGVAVVMGFGLGYHIAALADRLKGIGCVRVFEPDVALLRAVLERIDITSWFQHGNVAVHIRSDDAAEVAAGLQGSEALPMLGAKLLSHPPSKRRLGDSAAEFGRTFAQVVKAIRTNIVTTLVQVETTLRNELQNLDHYATRSGISELHAIAQGRPAIVISAGPSLQRNVELLKDPAIRDRFVIIAVQTVLKPLLAMGIRPHFVTAIDHHEISRRFYEGLKASQVEGITLVADAKANPAILDAYPGEIRCFQESTLDRVLGLPQDGGLAREMGELPPGATVAHTAYYLARYLGCDPVILVGQDLGFTDGQYYSAGAAIHQVWSGELNEFNTLEMLEWQRIMRMKSLLRKRTDQLGRAIYTDEQMATYLVQFERDFAADATRGLTTIDATEGGVAKAHTRIATLRGSIAELSAASTGLPALNWPSSPEAGPDVRAARLDAVRKRVAAVMDEVRAMRTLSLDTIALLEEAQSIGLDHPRAPGLIREVHEKRDRVLKFKSGYWLVQFLNQTGTLNRFKADRALKIDAHLPEGEQQRRRLGRDCDNVRWIAGAAESLERLIDGALATLSGAPKITRDSTNPIDAGDTQTSQPSSIPARRVAFIVQADTEFTGLGLPRRRPLDAPLRATIERLLSSARCSLIVIAATDAPAVRTILADRAMDSRIRIAGIDAATLRRHTRWVGAARLWSRECWRGGIANMSCYDEACSPATLAALMAEHAIDAAAVVGADWCEVDVGLCDQALARMQEDPDRHHVTFVHAPPGIGTCVVARTVVEELRDNPGPFGTLGALLGYIPVAPQADPIAKPACIAAPAAIRDLQRRMIADDCPIDARAIETTDLRAQAGTLTLELAGFDALGEVRYLDDESINEAARLVRQRPGTAVTLAGDADAATHPRLLDVAATLRGAGAAGLHLRTWLTCDAAVVERMLDCFDVVSVDLGAGDADRFERAMDRVHPMRAHPSRDLFELNRANLELLITLREIASPDTTPRWIVPRLSRTDDTYEQIESLYDQWLMRLGAAVIDPGRGASARDRIRPLPLPPDAAARRKRNELFLTADGESRRARSTEHGTSLSIIEPTAGNPDLSAETTA